MYYKKRNKERRFPEPAKTPKRGAMLTFLSLAMAGAFIAVSKAANPRMNVTPMLLMLGGVALGCFIMIFVAGRKRNDD
ncbi:MAG: hypothetical protein LBB28_00945 [Synergistaceae bacterium]|jgi:hypothetical protein|nr:hypothetical protein [Synergistaceae bacterium]